MIAIINIIVMVLSGVLFLLLYVKSVRPATLELKIGAKAYKKCTFYRSLSSIPMGIICINYILYFFFPLKSLLIPEKFPWGWPFSIGVGILFGIPSCYLLYKGMKDAGKETMVPKKEHTLYQGIYKRIRHPQALGELMLWWVFSFLLNSPFLVIFSFVWLPVWYIMCIEEEKDLVIRYGKPFEEYRKNTGMFIPRIKL